MYILVKARRLECSHFEPIPSERVDERLPCVIYLHGNCSSRLEVVCKSMQTHVNSCKLKGLCPMPPTQTLNT